MHKIVRSGIRAHSTDKTSSTTGQVLGKEEDLGERLRINGKSYGFYSNLKGTFISKKRFNYNRGARFRNLSAIAEQNTEGSICSTIKRTSPSATSHLLTVLQVSSTINKFEEYGTRRLCYSTTNVIASKAYKNVRHNRNISLPQLNIRSTEISKECKTAVLERRLSNIPINRRTAVISPSTQCLVHNHNHCKPVILDMPSGYGYFVKISQFPGSTILRIPAACVLLTLSIIYLSLNSPRPAETSIILVL